jgi:sporulation protein YlmC with PRC-barrel domain
VRLTRVPGLPVVDTRVARQAGVVSDVLLDLHAGRVAVLNVKHGGGYALQRIPSKYVYRLGPRTVLVAETVAVDLGPPTADQPWFPIESFVGLNVLTDAGERIGQLVDADLDDSSLAVKAYLMRHVSGAWRRRRRIHPDEVVMCSPELMLIRAKKKA